MRNHQQTDPDDATIATVGEGEKMVKMERKGKFYQLRNTDLSELTVIDLKATFWKPIIPEPGYRLVEDHERVGEKPKGCRIRCKDGSWNTSYAVEWANNETYAVPIEKQVVAWDDGLANTHTRGKYLASFLREEDRDRAVERANKGEL